ncbi:MAG: hypothetical protein II975_02090, partial [Bacteroidales bacterium]|nr:hypothetical protein [Bacteroidales bacterium]
NPQPHPPTKLPPAPISHRVNHAIFSVHFRHFRPFRNPKNPELSCKSESNAELAQALPNRSRH